MRKILSASVLVLAVMLAMPSDSMATRLKIPANSADCPDSGAIIHQARVEQEYAIDKKQSDFRNSLQGCLSAFNGIRGLSGFATSPIDSILDNIMNSIRNSILNACNSFASSTVSAVNSWTSIPSSATNAVSGMVSNSISSVVGSMSNVASTYLNIPGNIVSGVANKAYSNAYQLSTQSIYNVMPDTSGAAAGASKAVGASNKIINKF